MRREQSAHQYLSAFWARKLVCCLIDGVFAAAGEGVRFHEATELGDAEVAEIQEVVRQRVLGLFARRALLDPEAVGNMRHWEHGGFSHDATIRIDAWDRDGLEWLLRYCARPALSSERLSRQKSSERVIRTGQAAAPCPERA